MKCLRVNEAAERFVNERDMGFVEQMMDVLRSPKNDPVERKLEQETGWLDPDLAARFWGYGASALQFVSRVHLHSE
jgi:hypothetical protein